VISTGDGTKSALVFRHRRALFLYAKCLTRIVCLYNETHSLPLFHHTADFGWQKALDKRRQVWYVITYTEDKNMTTLTSTEARKQLFSLVDSVAETHDPVQITGKRNSAILISEDDWRAIQETLYLVSIPGMRESIVKGLQTPVDECATELDW